VVLGSAARAAGGVAGFGAGAAGGNEDPVAGVAAGVAAPGLVGLLEQRGAGGGQADLVLRGGTFEQALVLLNGFRITTARPRITISTCPSARRDGLDPGAARRGLHAAWRGRIERRGRLSHRRALRISLRLRAGAGSFGENEESLLAALARKRWSSRLTAAATSPPDSWPTAITATKMLLLESWISSKPRHLGPALCHERPLLRRKPVLWSL
jgi:hypothetical protein